MYSGDPFQNEEPSPKPSDMVKETRVVCLLSEPLVFLRDTIETAPVGKVYVIWKYRGKNLRTEFERIMERTGVDLRPGLFRNPLIKVVQIWQQRANARWSLKRKKPRQLPRLFSNVLQ
ncbi:MAG: hypothetical protein GY748_09770 [Planctomycetaceae bacterium]|nr:hypothetical protein [Planctomycetaceae bacterium]